MARDLFISFSSRDKEKAALICERLEREGLECWISLRDVGAGENYQTAIVRAIQAAKVLILVLSSQANESREIHKELSLASACRAAVIPVRVAYCQPEGALLYELATCQWIEASEAWDSAMDQLVAAVQRTLEVNPKEAALSGLVVPVPQQAAMAAPAAASSAPVFEKEDIDLARDALATYMGPIASLLVRKAAANATSLADLHNRLSEHIETPEEQAIFKRKLKRHA